jgi:hypothetical protein
LVAGAASAQDSRAAIIEAEQAAKAKTLAPYVPSRAERVLVTLQREMLQDPSGLYPFFGSVYSGGGFTLGGGYRQFYGDRTHADVKGMYSFKNYKFIELSTDSWGHAGGRLDLHARTGWRDATQVAYHGLGMDSSADPTAFGMKQAYAGGDVGLRPLPWSIFRAGISYEDYSLGEGAGSNPSIEEVFTPATAPGLGASPKYLHSMVSAGLDSRPSAGYARSGGLYEVSYHNYADRGDTYSFDQLNAEVVQHIPILRETWVLSFHGLLNTTPDEAGHRAVFRSRRSAAQHPPRIQQLALPRSQRHPHVGRISLDSQPPGTRHGAVLRHRQGDAALP